MALNALAASIALDASDASLDVDDVYVPAFLHATDADLCLSLVEHPMALELEVHDVPSLGDLQVMHWQLQLSTHSSSSLCAPVPHHSQQLLLLLVVVVPVVEKKCRKGGGWGEVGLYVACYGFMFVVNLCSLLLMFFVAVVWVLQGSEVFRCSG